MKTPKSEKSSLNHPLETLSEKPPSDFWSAARTIIKLQRQAPPIQPISRNGNLPLSFAQERLWFLHQLQPDSLSYQSLRAYRLIGSLNVTALQQSLNYIQQRHEVLRTTFPTIDGRPVQVINPAAPFNLRIADLRKLTKTEREAEAHRQATEEAEQPFDLAKGLLWRVKLLRLAEAEYVLLLTMHHIVYDGWSLQVFFRELAALYQAFSTEKSSLRYATLTPLLELPIQYADFAVWQRQWLSGEVIESQLLYWKQQLSGILPVLQLPTDHPRPPIQTDRGAYQSLALPLELTDALKSLSQQSGATLFMTLLAAFKTLLYRYTGQEDIIVGTPIANRNRREIQGLIGFFANTLVLRTELSGNPTFRELLNRIQRVASGAYAHQDLPFEKLVEVLQPERDLSRTPLFQVMFAFQNPSKFTLELTGLTINSLKIHNTGTGKFDLTLYVEDTAQGLRGSLEYNTDLFDATTITRMAGHFQTLLEGIVANPDRRLSDLPLLTAAERHQLLFDRNNTQTKYPNNTCIHQLFEFQIKQTPDAIAAIFENQQLTYLELNAKANQLAHYLQKLGVKPEVLVGICVERSLDLLVAVLSILKAGGAYVPLDPAYPQERLNFMLEDTQIPILLTQQPLLNKFPKHKAHVVCLDRDREEINRENEQNPTSSVTANNLAYVIYTSGSAGQPKGVQVLHRAVVNLLNSMGEQPGLTNQDILLSVTSLSFDIAALELFLPIIVGAKVVLVSREIASDGLKLSACLVNSGATVMQATPATWQLLLEAGWGGSNRLKILCGGEALPRTLANQLLKRGASLWNLYGPTETTIWSAVCKIESEEGSVSIGKPIANTQIYLLDSHCQPVPIGVFGELHIGGVGLARGYLNLPNLTAEKFIPNPFSNKAGDRLYKTGDLARYLADGNIEFLGRIDHQVKIRGFRIELEEIEAVLAQHPAVQQAVITAREDVPGDKRLVAYVVTKQKQASTTDELHRFLKQKLPDYMVPGAYVFFEVLPLTPNGKLDRHALPAPEQKHCERGSAFVAPQDTLELHLMKIWEKVLGIQPIGVRDNFFALGGHSLLAVRLFAQIEQIFSQNLPLATLFQAPTIEQIASILRQSGWSAPWRTLVAIRPGGSKPPLFCIPAAGSSGLGHSPLARHLDPDLPIYGIQALGFDGKQAPQTRIEDMAALYIQEIRTLQPEGPYFLEGHCFGGLVAFEIAQQLHQQGQKVALLALLDVTAPTRFHQQSLSDAPKQGSLRKRIARNWDNFSQLGFIYLLQKVKYWRQNISRKIDRIFCKFYLYIGHPLPHQIRYVPMLEAAGRAIRNYSPQVYPGRVSIFMASTWFIKEELEHEFQFGWGELVTEGLEIHQVSGDHHSMIADPNVQELAEKLMASIDKALIESSDSLEPKKSVVEAELKVDCYVLPVAEATETEHQINKLRHQTERNPWSFLVAIQPGGSKKPFFIVPGGGGGEPELITYAKLVYFLGQEQPVYGLQASGSDGKQNPHTEVELMASDYIKEIRTLQTEGPYLLGGECIGGAVAFEMAQQLIAQGQKVALLILLDSKCPNSFRKRDFSLPKNSLTKTSENRFKRISHFLIRTLYHLSKFRHIDSKEWLSYFFDKTAKAVGSHPNIREAHRLQQVRENYISTLLRYRPQTYTGRLTLLVNEQQYHQDPTMGWDNLAGEGLEIHQLLGDHNSYLGEYVQSTSEKLKACLDAAQVDD